MTTCAFTNKKGEYLKGFFAGVKAFTKDTVMFPLILYALKTVHPPTSITMNQRAALPTLV